MSLQRDTMQRAAAAAAPNSIERHPESHQSWRRANAIEWPFVTRYFFPLFLFFSPYFLYL